MYPPLYGYHLYKDSSGMLRFDQLFNGAVYALVPNETDYQRKLGYYNKDFEWLDPDEDDEDDTTTDAWQEALHPRGQPENAGEFVSKGQGAANASNIVPLFAEHEVANVPKAAKQPVRTPEDMQPLVQKGQQLLEEWLNKGNGVASKAGFQRMATPPENTDLTQPGKMLFIAPPKSMGRATEKVNADYGGDWSQLLDPVRCSLAVDTFEDVKKTLERLQQSGMTLARQPKDRFSKPTPSGYRDCMLNVQLPNGLIAEVQLHLKQMLEAKNEGHHLYEVERSLDAKKQSGRPLSAEEETQRRTVIDQQNRLYNHAWLDATRGARVMAAAGDSNEHNRYSYFEYDNALYRRDNHVGTRSINDVLLKGEWKPYTGDRLAPAVFGDEIGDPLAIDDATHDAFNESNHARGGPRNAGQFVRKFVAGVNVHGIKVTLHRHKRGKR